MAWFVATWAILRPGGALQRRRASVDDHKEMGETLSECGYAAVKAQSQSSACRVTCGQSCDPIPMMSIIRATVELMRSSTSS